MFTGIIEEIGKIVNIKNNFGTAEFEFEAQAILEDVEIGNSIAVNGVCTTVTEFSHNTFKVDLSSQTLNVTTFNNSSIGDYVNLERALKVSDRLNGHIVSGHVDCVAQFLNKEEKDNSIFLTFKIPKDEQKYFIDKGSVTINGISLTICNKQNDLISVCIIPHTYQNTNLKYLKLKQNVNIEIDLVAKYIENFVNSNDNNTNITEKFLKENGF